MFDIEIWPHEFYFVAGLLIMAGIGLFLVTSAVGRAWCGYACPQTVWTDLFQHIDRFFDGDRNARARLDKAPWTAGKITRRTSKWAVYLVISFWTRGDPDRNHLLARRVHARTGVHLYVPVAAHPDRDAR
jgi:polyferredoxin